METICITCWSTIDSFHKLYSDVEQRNNCIPLQPDNLVKYENDLDDSRFLNEPIRHPTNIVSLKLEDGEHEEQIDKRTETLHDMNLKIVIFLFLNFILVVPKRKQKKKQKKLYEEKSDSDATYDDEYSSADGSTMQNLYFSFLFLNTLFENCFRMVTATQNN